jgi:transposase InsO family protein
VWELDLIDVQNLAKYNDNQRYLLSAIEVFSKFLHIFHLKSKTGQFVASAFLSIFDSPKYKKPLRTRPIWVRTDRGKEFLNNNFQDALKLEGIDFQFVETPT